MKKIVSILASLMMYFTLSSCVTTAQAQIDDMYDDVDISVVVSYGTPYYNTEGLLLYYIYRDMFYYPYYYNNRYYLHRYHRPLPLERMGRYKPVPRDFYHHNRPPHRNRVTPPNRHTNHMYHNNYGNRPMPNVGNKPNTNIRPNINRGNGTRFSTQQRSSTRATVRNGRNFGGRR